MCGRKCLIGFAVVLLAFSLVSLSAQSQDGSLDSHLQRHIIHKESNMRDRINELQEQIRRSLCQ